MNEYIEERKRLIDEYTSTNYSGGELHHIKLCSMCKTSTRYGSRSDYVYDIDAEQPSNKVRVPLSVHFKLHWLEYKIWENTDETRPAQAFILMFKSVFGNTNQVYMDGDFDIESFAKDYENAKIQAKKTIENGDYIKFGYAPPWEATLTDQNTIRKWEMMPILFKLWNMHDRPSSRKFSDIVNGVYGMCFDMRTMIAKFKDEEKYSQTLEQWNVWIMGESMSGFSNTSTELIRKHNLELHDENAELRRDNARLMRRNEVLADRLCRRDSTISDQKHTLENRKRSITSKVDEIKSLKHELSTTKGQLSSALTKEFGGCIGSDDLSRIRELLAVKTTLSPDALKVKRYRWKAKLVKHGRYSEFSELVNNLVESGIMPDINSIYNIPFTEIWDCHLINNGD